MQLNGIEAVSVVHQIRCDRCGKEVQRSELGFEQMTSIGFDAGYNSIFGDGNRVMGPTWPTTISAASIGLAPTTKPPTARAIRILATSDDKQRLRMVSASFCAADAD
ncbi:hypothetical protein [Polaromonas sp. JS666]|uniref:hypothetical protein n=1 Tax=Polaromonas sp. (strain JS666 / ATCC BAA-500) TaxID=296591 RepID=UPI00059D8E9B|nr:hypothetical protein [Polaromonas sp. JS666]